MAGRFSEYAEREGLVPASGQAAPPGYTDAYQGRFLEYAQENGGPPEGQVDLTGTFRQWYTGQNLQGIQNGWDSDFMRAAQDQYVAAQERDDVLGMFARDDAMGVVTWDNAGQDSKGNDLQFGDIVSGGQRVGNVYEDVDRHSANVLMGDWTIQDGARKARLNEEADPVAAWEAEMDQIRRSNTQLAETAPRHEQFQEDIEERAEGENEYAIAAAGAGATAASFAAIGATLTAWSGPGALLGAAVGGTIGTLVGGLGAWLNQDSLAYQIARERERIELVREQENGIGTAGQVMSTVSQLTTSLAMSPFSNMVQGLRDVGSGHDASSGGEFYATNDEGERTTGWQWQVADLVAKVGDSAAQFLSPLGRSAYMAQMSVGIAGRASGLLPGVGTWDESTLRLDSVWTDDQGNFDPLSAAAGVGNVTVEAVQLGGARGLFSSLRRTPTSTQGNWIQRSNLTSAQRQALKDGGELQQLSGWKFVRDSQGRVVGEGRTTLSMLAPSEALQSLSTKAIARRAAAREGGALDADRLYQTAYEMSIGQRWVQSTLVNAFGEAQEEGLQQILEPLSHGNSIDAEEVFQSAAAGFASGLGMGLADAAVGISSDKRMYATASMAYAVRTGGDKLSYSDWQDMSDLEKRTMVRSAQVVESVMEGAYKSMEGNRTRSVQGDVVAAAHVTDWWKKFSTAQLNRGTRATDASHTIVMLDDARFRSDAMATSHTQLLADQQNRVLGIRTQIQNMQSTDAQGKPVGALVEARRYAAEHPGDPAAQERVAKLEGQLDKLNRMLVFAERAEQDIDRAVLQITAAVKANDRQQVSDLVRALNQKLASWYDGDNQPAGFSTPVASVEERLLLSRAVARIATRHPEDSTASFQSFLPQVDEVFAIYEADGVAAVSQLTNKGMRSDFDGDKVHELQQLQLDDKEYVDLRSGSNILGASLTPEIGTTAAEKYLYNEIRVALTDSNGAVRGIAQQFGNDIADSLQQMYVDTGLIPAELIDQVMVEVRDAIATGGDVANVLLTEMVRRAGSDLMAIGRGEKPRTNALVTNEYFALARMVSEQVQQFQERYAQYRPLPQGASTKQTTGSRASTAARTIRGIEAATEGATITTVVSGDNLFRMFQHLHYNLMSSSQKWVGWSSEARDEGFQRLVEFYEQLSREATGLKYEEVTAGDAIVDSTLAKLSLLAQDPAALAAMGVRTNQVTSMSMLANVGTARWVWDTNPTTKQRERRYTGETVTLVQQLLYMSAEEFKGERSQTWEGDQAAQASYRRLVGLTSPPKQKAKRQANAERAFVEVFDAVPLYDMAGEASSSLGITLTVGQFYRRILSMSPEQRSAEQAVLRGMPEYLARIDNETNKVGVPYEGQQLAEGRVTAYRTLVDSVFSSASAAISRTQSGATKGAITGHMADTSSTIETEIQDTYEAVRRLMRKWRAQASYTAQDVAEFVEQDPDAGRLILRGIPEDLMPVVYKGATKDGKPLLAEWYYRVFAEKNAKKAAWTLRWNTWYDGWLAVVGGLELDEEKKVSYDQLDSRFHRLLAQLSTASVPDQGTLQELLIKGETADSTEEFMAWLNGDSGLVTSSDVPMLAWVDDTAEFDETKTGSGWSEKKSTTQLREDWKALRDGVNRRYDEVTAAAARRAEDMDYVRSIRRGFKSEQGILKPGEVASRDDIDNWRRFRAAVDNAKKADVAYGPRAMVMTTAINVFGIYGQAHTKGSNPEHLAVVEAAEAMLGAFGYTVNLERLVGDVTTHDENAVAAAPELIVKDAGRLMDKDGNTVEWSDQTAEDLLNFLEADSGDVDTISLVTTMLTPQVIEMGQDSKPRRQALDGLGIKALLDSTSKKDRYRDDGALALRDAMKYLIELESRLRLTDPFAVQRRVSEIVLARTSSLDHAASLQEIQSMTVQAYLDLAEALQAAAQIQQTPGQPDELTTVWEAARDDMRVRAGQRLYGISGEYDSGTRDLLVQAMEAQTVLRYAKMIEATNTEINSTTDAARIRELEAHQDDLERRMVAEQERIRLLVNGNVVDQTVNTYLYDAKMPDQEKVARRDQLIEFVASNTDLLPAMGKATPHVQRIMRYLYDRANVQNATQPNLTDEQWTELSRMAISLHLNKLVSVGSGEHSPPAYPSGDTGRLDLTRYWDFTWSYLADFLDPSKPDGLLAAAREHAKNANRTTVGKTPSEVMRTLKNTVLRDDLLGPWTAAIPIQGIEQYELTTGASSSVSISMAGLLTQRWSAASAATRRTFELPPATMDWYVALEWSDLDWENDPNGLNDPYERMVELVLPDSTTLDRPLIQVNKRFARMATVDYRDPRTGGLDTLDLMQDNATSPWGPAMDDPSISQELRVISLERIKERVEALADSLSNGDRALKDQMLDSLTVNIDFLHPEGQPSDGDYYNNLWFEGTVFDSYGDVSDSLLYSLWFGAGGINAQVQQAALDTRKLGLAGIEHYIKPNLADVRQLEAEAEQDFGLMIAGKARLIMQTDLGNGRLNDNFYNAVHKLMKLKHWVDGTDQNGNPVRLSAEQVIARQRQYGQGYWNEDGTPLADARLWIPSDQILAEVMGEQGYGGVRGRVTPKPLSTDTDTIPTYRGWPANTRLPVTPQPPRSLTDTAVAHTVRLSEPITLVGLDAKQEDKFKLRSESFRFHRARVHQDRRSLQAQANGFNPEETRSNFLQRANDWLQSQDITLSLGEGLAWAELPAAESLTSTRQLLDGYINTYSSQSGGNMAGWVFDYGGPSDPYGGQLSSLDDVRGKLSLAPGDIMVVNLASFYREGSEEAAREKAKEVVDYLVSQNVAIVPLSSGGPSNLVAETSARLRNEHRYQRYEGNSRILVPEVMAGRRYQNEAASQSTLTRASGVTVRLQKVLVLLKNRRVEENTMVIPTNRRTKFESVQYQRDLLPTNVSASFGVPRTSEHLAMTVNHLQGLNNAQGIAHLKSRLKGTEAEAGFEDAWKRLMDRIDSAVQQGTTLPQPGDEFGTGDLIPLLSNDGELLLYMHGYNFPYKDFHKQLGMNVQGNPDARNVAIYSGKPVPGASTHRGIVSSTKNRQKFGIQLELEIDSKALGSKQVVELNGMKWLLAPKGDQFEEPSAPILGSGPDAVWVDGYGSLHDAWSKQAVHNMVLNTRNAFSMFGVDMLPKIARALGGLTEAQALEILRAVERAPGKRTETATKDLQDMLAGSYAPFTAIRSLLPKLNAAAPAINWESLVQGDNLDTFSLRAMLLYLTTEGASLDAVLYSSGLWIQSTVEPGAQSQRMPDLFTRMFDLTPMGSTVRTEMFDEFNSKLGGAAGRSEWILGQDWTLYGISDNGEQIEGVLDFGEAHVSDDNPELNVQAQDRKVRQSSTMHASLVTEFGVGGDMYPSPEVLARVDKALSEKRTRLESGELWRSFTKAARETFGPGSQWQQTTPAEHEYHGLSMQRFLQYRVPIDWKQETLNEGDDAQKLESKRQAVMTALGWDSSMVHHVDYWIRQILWKPAAAPGQTNYDDVFTTKQVLLALDTILGNLEGGRFPTYGGAGPSQISETDLRVMNNMARRSSNSWRPRRRAEDAGSEVDPLNYGDWIAASFGQAWNTDVEVDDLARLDYDGFMNSYREILKQRGRFMDITMDKELQGKLLDGKTNELIAYSTSPVERSVLMETVILPSLRLGLDGLRHGVNAADSLAGWEPSDSWKAHARKRRADYRRKNKIRPKERTSARDYVKHGATVLEGNSKLHTLSRILLALRHGTTMLNPGLYVSMIPEQAFRLYLRGVADVLSGQSTGGVVGRTAARVGLSEFTPETINSLNALYRDLSADNTFPSIVIKEMMYKQPQGPNDGAFVRAAEKFAQFGNKWQDPTWNIPQKALARTYVESVIRAVQARPINNVMTVDMIISALRKDHAYFAKHHPEIHEIASNNVTDNRGLKNTIWSQMLKAAYEPLSRSSSPTVNFAGTLIKLPLMYGTFLTNMLTTLTGMQGWSQAAAVFFDQRQTAGTLMNRMAKKLKGEEITDADDVRYDLSSTMDGYTLVDAFIRGGVTQTSLFTLGMLAGGILGGEDDEAERRRKLAKAQNVPLLADPRRLEADFRNKDLFFLDWLPSWLEPLKAASVVSIDPETGETRSALKLSWLMKPFLSPILGMEKFIQTGDFGWVTFGFADAVGSLPLFNKAIWDDAVKSADELTALAQEQQELGTAESTNNTMYLLISAVGVYERMLFENMFINSIYTGFDKYDRDVTALPLRDSDGDIQTTIEGDPRANDLALEMFLNDDGEVAAGYKNRDEWSKLRAYYSKNSYTAMAMLQIMTGFREDLYRYQMPVKMRKIELEETPEAEAADLVGTILAAEYAKNGGPKVLSLEEITKQLSSYYAENGMWDAYNGVDAEAAKMYEDQKLNPVWNPLSVLNEDGQEVPTTDGAAAVLKGLTNGLVDLDSPALQNFSISRPMREQLQADFLADVTQQGVDWGMTNTQAVARAERLFYGPFDDPTIPGFADVLWSDKIPYSPNRYYKQLNTTYVPGPDGFPWATGFKRGGVLNQLGLPQRANISMSNATTTDSRLNTVDLVAGINTGMRGVEPFHPTENVPTDVEIGKSIEDAIRKLKLNAGDFTPFDNRNSSGRFYGGYRRGTGGSFSSSTPRIYFSRQPYLADGTNVYGDSTRNIFWDNTTVRRSRIRRERYTSQRGRLNQWQ